MTRRTPYTNTEFADAARLIQGDKYGYSQVDYKNNRTPVVIECRIHGSFSQSPGNHLRGKGCPKCARQLLADKYRKSPDEFLRQANVVHGSKYDYSKVAYSQAKSKVEIVCPKHGSFWQTPDAHLQGKGCTCCSNEVAGDQFSMSLDEFVSRANARHGDKFDYSLTKYKTAWVLVEIICPKHGSFTQAPVTHLLSVYGCSKCAHEMINRERKLTTKDFLKRAQAVHGNKYDYSLVECRDAKTDISIICPKHGPFNQAPGEHLSGRGCKKCGNELIASKQTMPQMEFIAMVLPRFNGYLIKSDNTLGGRQCKSEENTVRNTNRKPYS